ncbi:MAG: hypothetical protein GVY19_08240 [Bacteroidetes bacterium]|jgi:signal transduction histidine kinase|nr:hypothetical protein [Bacteroidota bacterium]
MIHIENLILHPLLLTLQDIRLMSTEIWVRVGLVIICIALISWILILLSKRKTVELNKSKNKIAELEKQLEEKDKFISIIAHDLKDPFNNLSGLTALLKQNHESYDSQKRGQLISEIHHSSLYLYEFVNNLLLWSRSQQNTIQFNPGKQRIGDIFFKNKNVLQSQASAKEIKLTFETEHENELVVCDENLLNTVLRNLITNAIKFTPVQGRIKVICAKQNGAFLFSVEDNGMGMEEGRIPKLFKPEEKFSATGTNYEQGTGMGLIICKEFVEKHNGKIWVESNVQQGTKFLFTIPFESDVNS